MYAQNPGTGFTIWVTGMQGAGKSALAREVAARLRRLEKPVELLEGQDWDVFIGKGPGAHKDERNALMRRAAFVARAITRAGGFCIVAQTSPIRETREAIRREIGRFIEVFVDAPFPTLMARDASGQYTKALKGEITNFVGVTDPYEPPAAPEVKVDSSKMSVDDEATLVLEALVREGALHPSDIGLSRVPPESKEKKPRKPPENILFTPEMLTLPKVARTEASKAAPAKAPAKAEAPAKAPAPTKAAPVKAAKPAPAKAAPPAKAKAPVKPAARTRQEAESGRKAAPARARTAAPVKAAKKVAAKTARAKAPKKADKDAKKDKKGKKAKR